MHSDWAVSRSTASLRIEPTVSKLACTSARSAVRSTLPTPFVTTSAMARRYR